MNNMSTRTVSKYDDVINNHKGITYNKNSDLVVSSFVSTTQNTTFL